MIDPKQIYTAHYIDNEQKTVEVLLGTDEPGVFDAMVIPYDPTTDNMKAGDYFMTTNINGDQIRIEQAKALFVKDMVIQSQSIRVGQSKIVPIECVMFVQPSKSDHRLSSSQQEQFPITSCCLRTVKEVKAFVQHTVLDAAEAFD